MVISQLQREVLLSIKGLCMKESDTLADNVVISQLQREILLATKKVVHERIDSFLQFSDYANSKSVMLPES